MDLTDGDDADTLAQGRPERAAGAHGGSIAVDARRVSLDLEEVAPSGARYEVRCELGKGGMGAVHLCHDQVIGRDIALKSMLPEARRSSGVAARFLREARVQGQLEHPAIVPVYDVGVDEQGAAFFTMKRLRGLTLAQILRGLRKGDVAITQAYSRRKLLTAFSSLCLAVDFAHVHGVLHRDLKPANVMLGDYGEVYLLDWGIAKILDRQAPAIDLRGAPPTEITVVGNLLGTPGYMSPEQAWGNTDQLDARSDVYALGALLFEILALEPLHPRTDTLDVLRSTARGEADARAGVRCPERSVPPELDAICVTATMVDPAQRYPSARLLCDAVERFLDGDRNMEMRRDLAAEHVGQAEAAARAMLAGGAEAEGARREALRRVGQALAVDPTNERALQLLKRIFLDPPRALPGEVQGELDAAVRDRHREHLRDGIRSDVLSFAACTPFAYWMGIRDYGVYVALGLLTAASSIMKAVTVRTAFRPSGPVFGYLAYLFNVLAVLTLSRCWGPLFFMPLILIVFAHQYCITPWARFRMATTVTAALAIVAAVGVEVSGVLPRSYSFHDGVMTILPRALSFPEIPSLIGLTVTALYMLFVPVRMLGRIQTILAGAERRATLQTWQLKQLLPEEAQHLHEEPAG
jgi:serine/threonine-protein kinase